MASDEAQRFSDGLVQVESFSDLTEAEPVRLRMGDGRTAGGVPGYAAGGALPGSAEIGDRLPPGMSGCGFRLPGTQSMGPSLLAEINERVARRTEVGSDFELREVARWTVNCAHCGTQVIGDTPQTEKAFEALKRLLAGRRCPSPECVSNGGHVRRREDVR